MTAEVAGVGERERMAQIALDHLLVQGEDNRHDSPYVVDETLAAVQIDGWVDLLRLADALLAAGFGDVAQVEAERVRLVGIINEARNFDGMQTVNGVTDEGWMSPDEWLLGKIDDILEQADK